jgi:hypothetical protein
MHETGSVQQSAAVRLQLEGQIFALVEDWRRSQPKIPSRSKAVCLLIERALTARPDGPPPEMRRRPNSALHLTTNSTQKLETVPATPPT